MTLARTFAVPPDLAEAVIAKCSETVLRGLETAPGVTLDELIDDVKAKRAVLWLILEGQEPLATALTEIVHEDDTKYVAVFGLGGAQMWKWARTFAQTVSDYARDEGCERVRFAGSKAWARVVPHCHRVGTRDGEDIWERAVQ